jgi:hypothetical protein
MAITKLVITGNTTAVGLSSTPITISLAHKAQSTSVVPDDNITATNVQDALEQLDDIKAPIASPDFTGTVTMDGLTVDANTATFSAGTSGDMKLVLEADTDNNEEGDTPKIQFKMDGGNTFGHVGFVGTDGDLFTGSIANSLALGTDVNTRVQFYTFDKLRQQISNNGDISFYEDTGTTPKFFWDASAESLGIGTSSPSEALEVTGNIQLSGGADRGIIGPDFRSLNIFANPNSSTEGIKFSTNGGTTTEVFIQDGGNVGIGTSSPSRTLDIESLVPAVRFTDASVSGLYHEIVSGDSNNLQIKADGGAVGPSSAISFDVDGSEKMCIKHTGNVGIGTASPDRPLDITDSTNDGTGGAVIHSYLPTLELDDISGGGTSFILQHDATNTLLKHGTTERMRIDSDGNLLVGKTSSTFNNTAGIGQFPSGRIYVTRNNGNCLYLNRVTSNGDIAAFYKDGLPVGSIGSVIGQYLRIGSGDVGIMFQDGSNAIEPRTTADANRDDAISLGASPNRFKDLYLSGGVYLGGTGSANKLDDYEEGTWTPTIIGATTAGTTSFTVSSSTYVKVGALVTVQCYLQNIDGDNTTASGNLQITGLPFVSEKFTPITLSHVNCFDFDEQTTSVSGYTNQGNTRVSLVRGSSTELLSAANLSGTGKYLMFHATYKTTE